MFFIKAMRCYSIRQLASELTGPKNFFQLLADAFAGSDALLAFTALNLQMMPSPGPMPFWPSLL
jgi:hypothetical protein